MPFIHMNRPIMIQGAKRLEDGSSAAEYHALKVAIPYFNTLIANNKGKVRAINDALNKRKERTDPSQKKDTQETETNSNKAEKPPKLTNTIKSYELAKVFVDIDIVDPCTTKNTDQLKTKTTDVDIGPEIPPEPEMNISTNPQDFYASTEDINVLQNEVTSSESNMKERDEVAYTPTLANLQDSEQVAKSPNTTQTEPEINVAANSNDATMVTQLEIQTI